MLDYRCCPSCEAGMPEPTLKDIKEDRQFCSRCGNFVFLLEAQVPMLIDYVGKLEARIKTLEDNPNLDEED